MTGPGSPNGGSGLERAQVKQACTVLYEALPGLDAERLQADVEPYVGPCRVEWAASGDAGLPMAAGLAEWGPHRIAMIALNAPVKEEVLARTVGVSPMPEEMRSKMMAHRAAIRLLYVGEDPSALAQLTALYRVAGALALRGGLGIINERAALGQPTDLVATYLPQLGGNPPPLELWVGVVTFPREDEGPSRQYLMRTYGMEQFDLPELAIYMADRSAADDCYHTLLNTGLYMIESGPDLKLEPGHSVDFLTRTYLLTEPKSDDPVFASPTGLMVLVEV